MSLNQSMNIAINSMQNNQYALSVVSHNIANLNTEGYHRQRVNFSEEKYTTDCKNVLDTVRGMQGAKIDSLSGFMDEGAFKDVVDKNADAKYYDTLSGILNDIEDVADEIGKNGLGNLLNEFYNAANNLEKYPTDMSIRQQFLLAAENVCERFNYTSSRLDSLENEKYDGATRDITAVNSLLASLADANLAHVTNNQSDTTKATIDNIVSQLSNYVNISTETNANGSINVYIGGTAVVQGSEVKYTMTSSYDKSSDEPLSIYLEPTADGEKPTNNVNKYLTAGSLRAYTEALNGSDNKLTSITNMQKIIDKAAAAFGKALNDIQTFADGDVIAASITSDGSGNMILEQATVDMITTKDGSSTITAGNIQVNPAMDDNPYLVAAARVDKSQYEGDEWKKAIGNSDNAAAFSALRNDKIIEYDSGIYTTLSDYLVNNAAKAGMDAANVADKAELYQDLADNAARNYTNLIGVNLDEELANMIKYQRSFEASARVFAAVNSMMETILNMV